MELTDDGRPIALVKLGEEDIRRLLKAYLREEELDVDRALMRLKTYCINELRNGR